MNFRSDNVGAVAPEIMAALEAANHGPAASYGDDEHSARLNDSFSRLFETPVTVFPVSTGTVANALSLAAMLDPWGGVFCHELSHIHVAEGNATEGFTAGAKLLALPGDNFRIHAPALQAALQTAGWGIRNRAQPQAVSITQASEFGTLYQLDDIAAIGEAAKSRGLRLHMDGARFANALSALNTTPAEMTWRRGVDILSFGATKNGAMSADAIVVFDKTLVEPLSYRLRRAGQTWSKMRFAAAQLEAYVADNLYIRLAARANALAKRLAAGLSTVPGVTPIAPVEANLLFLQMPPALTDALAAGGVKLGRRDAGVVRLVTRFDGPEADVDGLLALARAA
jgi:threonine aldolase